MIRRPPRSTLYTYTTLCRSLEGGALRRRLGHPAAAVDEQPFRLLGGLALGLGLVRRGIVVIGQPLVEENLYRLLIAGLLLRLRVGAAGPAYLGAFVPGEADPLQPVQDGRQRL